MPARAEHDRNTALTEEIIGTQHIVAAFNLMIDVLDAGLRCPHQRDGVMDRVDAHQWDVAAGRENPGSIVNISSDAGRAGSIGQINYAAAKSGLLGMTMSTAKEWSKFGVRTNSVCFGVVETPTTETIRGDKFRDGILARIPMGRWAAPEEAVKPVCFLLSDAASYITGQHIAVDGGFHISV
jgi:NAD(P)-dependent dehydrogenase (short-subunit alcohol dehydrogenase family)